MSLGDAMALSPDIRYDLEPVTITDLVVLTNPPPRFNVLGQQIEFFALPAATAQITSSYGESRTVKKYDYGRAIHGPLTNYPFYYQVHTNSLKKISTTY